jgi:hypothetical protein
MRICFEHQSLRGLQPGVAVEREEEEDIGVEGPDLQTAEMQSSRKSYHLQHVIT